MEITLSGKRKEIERIASKTSSGVHIDIKLFIIIGLIALVGFFAFSYYQEKNSSNTSTEEESRQIVEEVVGELEKMIILPEQETPTIATIINSDKLREQDAKFYENAENGDKIVFYSDKAIVFREDKNIIVNVAQIVDRSIDHSATEAN